MSAVIKLSLLVLAVEAVCVQAFANRTTARITAALSLAVTAAASIGFSVNTNDFHIVQCEYTPEYIAWTKLSDEEKENTIMPSMCDLSDSHNNISVSAITSQVKSIFDAKVTVLSSKYDPRKSSYMPDVKDQYPTGGCWAF